jgi:hypothetical protein
VPQRTHSKPRAHKARHRAWWQRTALISLGLIIVGYAVIWLAPDVFVWYGYPFAEISHPMLYYPTWARFTAALGFGVGGILLAAIGWLI